MADNTTIPMNHDNAVLLLDAAKALDLDSTVVRTTGEGTFVVPAEVAEKAGLGEKKAAAKKTAAKTTTAKKATAKKTAAKGQE